MFDMTGASNAISQNQQSMSAYSENMRNQFTPGYKCESVQFNDVMNSTMKGAKKKSSAVLFTQGEIFKTQTSTNLAINGQGFFMLNDGFKTHYSRDGRFTFQDGQLKSSDGKTVMGYQLDSQGNIAGEAGPINLSLDPNTNLYGGKYTSYNFDETGKLYGECTQTDPVTGQTTTAKEPIAQVAMASFANPGSLKRTGTTSFGESENSGQAVVGVAGQGALGQVCPGSLELSNVDFAQQGFAMVMMKQTYEANMASFRAMDKLTQSALGLVR
jgi:flagellar hook protein FlgE